MLLKIRGTFLLLVLIPQVVLFGLAYQTPLADNKLFSQVEALSLVSGLLIALSTPSVFNEWAVVRPLRALRQFCARIKAGHYQERFLLVNESRDGEDDNELHGLKRDMNWMVHQIEIREQDLNRALQDVSKAKREIDDQNQNLIRANQELMVTQKRLTERTRELEQAFTTMQVMAMTDPLTAIANRRCFFDTLERQFFSSMCDCPLVSLLVLDVDWFKKINDTYGHEAGDNVLLKIAELMQANIRSNDLAARIGGEEYAVLLQETSLPAAIEVAERIRKTVEKHPFLLSGNWVPISVTVSIGVCTASKCFAPAKCYSYADQALYFSKNNGRNMVSVFYPDTGLIARPG